jgi:hypothetical protein
LEREGEENKLRLFDITEQFKALELLEESDELPPEVIADTLEGLQGDFEAKAVQVAKFILSLEAASEDIDEAAKAMAARASRLKKRAESIRHYLLLQFQFIDWKGKITRPDIIVSRQNNPPAVIVSDETLVPANFWVQPDPPPKRIDKKSVKEALQAGVDVPGCYTEAGERIVIKI